MLSKNQIQIAEQRSIALYNSEEGIHSLPIYIDRGVFAKTPSEKANLQTVQSNFKRNGLREWNERNRPGNNKIR